MRNLRIVSFLLLILFLAILGCVQMRDYFGVNRGAFGLDVKKGFGEGEEKKDYYVTKDGIGLIFRDTKSEVISKIGLPDSIETTLESYSCWVYNERKLKLFFEGRYLNEWSEF